MLAAAIVGSVSTNAAAEVPVCHPVQPGDTAARLSLYLTGRPNNAFEPWFQIIDASHTRVVPKSQYSRIQPGWRACIPSSRLDIEGTRREPHIAAPPLKAPAAELTALAWWGVAAFGVVGAALIGHATRQWAMERRAALGVMHQFGERFIREFERPLMLPGCPERPVEARLRAFPRRKRLEILLAPTGSRRYPNLSDHRGNLTYDAERVVRLLKHEQFAGGQLKTHGRWVVIACHFKDHPEQRGTK